MTTNEEEIRDDLSKKAVQEAIIHAKKLAWQRALRRNIIPSAFLILLGFFLILASFVSNSIEFIFETMQSKHTQILLFGVSLIGFSIYTIYKTYSNYLQDKPSDFSDIDKSSTQTPSELEKFKTLTNQFQSRIKSYTPKQYQTFQEYFTDVIKFFDQQIDSSDRKASLLLDKGTAYSRNGVYFYIAMIITSQIIIYFTGYQQQHIYGLAGFSLVFIFVEFLSAWFLKQYRQYVDTSTYLIKIKTILERYFLVYLAIKEARENDKNHTELLDILKEDIKWPDTYLTKVPEVSFAKECIETATQLIRAVKSEANSKPKKD
ncbi:hypothetical protein SDC9_14446 [bioreactor metagenome]|uniref:Uncharacterized protein n=1 Tax=bioreactor metagenome TaxID=1076179 RepID=A0A644TP08_9ZZZZ|nr:hypothetical protein [Desulfovibrio desulfuricans]MEA4990694.1 hypothetical protein [Desulfovibrio desulfuricans]